MENLIKKSIIIGLGIAALTKDKAAEIIKDMSKEGGMTQKEGQRLMKEISEKIAGQKKAVEEEIAKAVKKVTAKMDIPSRKEIDELNKKIDKLQKQTGKK
jgi:polyhydroxyalkanoate synthesis regulator phasin